MAARLNPNELRAVLKVVELLVESGKVAGSGGVDGRHEVFIPDTHSRLVPAAGCLFNDAPWLARRLGDSGGGGGGGSGGGGLQLAHSRVPAGACRRLGMRRLSEAVTEELAPGFGCPPPLAPSRSVGEPAVRALRWLERRCNAALASCEGGGGGGDDVGAFARGVALLLAAQRPAEGSIGGGGGGIGGGGIGGVGGMAAGGEGAASGASRTLGAGAGALAVESDARAIAVSLRGWRCRFVSSLRTRFCMPGGGGGDGG